MRVQKQKAEQEPGFEAAVVPERVPPRERAREPEPEPEQDLRQVRKQGQGPSSEEVPGLEQEPCGVLEGVRPLMVVQATLPERPARAKWQGAPPRPEQVPGGKPGLELALCLELLAVPARFRTLKRVREPEPRPLAGQGSLNLEPGMKSPLEPEPTGTPGLKPVPPQPVRDLDLEREQVRGVAGVPALVPRLELRQAAERKPQSGGGWGRD